MSAADITRTQADSGKNDKVHIWAGWSITMAQVDAFVEAHNLRIGTTPAMAVVDMCEEKYSLEPQLVTPASYDRSIEPDELFLLFPIAFGEFPEEQVSFEQSGIAFTYPPLPECDDTTLAEARDILQLDDADNAEVANCEFTKFYPFVKTYFDGSQSVNATVAKGMVQELFKVINVRPRDIPFRFMQDPQQRLDWMSMRDRLLGDGVHDLGGQAD